MSNNNTHQFRGRQQQQNVSYPGFEKNPVFPPFFLLSRDVTALLFWAEFILSVGVLLPLKTSPAVLK